MKTLLFRIFALSLCLTIFPIIGSAANLLLEDFETPTGLNGASNPDFNAPIGSGNWVYQNTTNSGRNSDNSGDVPTNGGRNQVLYFNNYHYARYTLDHAWGAGNTYMLSFNASEQSWADSWDRGINVSIMEEGGTVLWTYLAILPQYTGGGSPWTADQTFNYIVPASAFSGGTPGTNILLEFDPQSGRTYNRGLYLDNVDFSEGTPPADNDPPTPDPMTFVIPPTQVDHQHVYMKATFAVDDTLGIAEYLFENFTTGTNSGWQSAQYWTQANVTLNTLYQYRVKARDFSSNQNETAWSSLSNVIVPPYSSSGILLAAGNFETPGDYLNGELNWDFIGWDRNTAKVRTGGGDGIPVDTTNQVIQFESTGYYLFTNTTHNWSPNDSYQLDLNVSPQSWSGGSQRYFEVSLEQASDGTQLWSQEDPVPLYDNFQQNPWTAAQTFSYSISASTFSAGTPGEPLRLKIENTNTGARGIYIDNVVLVLRQVFAKGTIIKIE